MLKRTLIVGILTSSFLLYSTVSPFMLSFWVILAIVLFLVDFAFMLIDNKFKESSIIYLVVVVVILFITVFNSPVFRASDYANIISTTDVNASNIIVSEPDKVRKVTEEMATVKANKILGRQIDGIEMNTQYELGRAAVIMYQGVQVWIFPLEYSGFFKWLSNDTIPGYILVSAIKPDSKPIFVNKPFKMSPSGYLFQNVDRITFFENGMTKNYRHLEIDEKGNPFWIFTRTRYKILGNVFEPEDIIIVDAINGNAKIYKLSEIPKWVDKVLPQSLAKEYIEYNSKYQKGFLNTIFTKVNILEPTVYNHSEIWLIENKLDNRMKWFTGLTSMNKKDNSLSAAIMVDTKTMNAYRVTDIQGITDESGATSAISSKLGANGMRWKAVVPMPIYINNEWFWTASIIDKKTDIFQKIGLVKGNDITDVIITNSLENAISNLSVPTSTNKMTPKEQLIHIINDLEKRLSDLRKEVETLGN